MAEPFGAADASMRAPLTDTLCIAGRTTMTVSEQTMRWLRFVSVTSIPLFKLDENELPCGVASGCLANIGGQKLILSVSHATGEGHWVAEMRFDPEQQKTLVHHFGDVWSVVHLDQNTSMPEELDVSGSATFIKVPVGMFLGAAAGGVIAAKISGATPSPQGSSPDDSRKRPYCAELSKVDAILCKHCGKDQADHRRYRRCAGINAVA